MRLSFEDKESFKEAAGSLRFNNSSSGSDSDPNTLQQVEISSSMSPQTSGLREEEICFNDPPSDLNPLQRVGSISSMPPRGTTEDST